MSHSTYVAQEASILISGRTGEVKGVVVRTGGMVEASITSIYQIDRKSGKWETRREEGDRREERREESR